GLDHGLGAGLAVFLQEVALKAAGIDADTHRAAMILGRLDHFLDALLAADIARVDAQTGRARLGRLDRALVVEVNVRHERDRDLAHDLLERRRRLLVGAGNAHDVGADLLQRLDLRDRRLHVRGQGVGHRLNGDRRVAADRDGADVDLAAFAAVDVAVWPDAHRFLGMIRGDARPRAGGAGRA